MTTVYWTPSFRYKTGCSPEVNILFEEPKPLVKEIAKEYKGYDFIKCPATLNFYKNIYVVTAPMDVVVNITKVDDAYQMHTNGYGWTQDFYDQFCLIRQDGSTTLSPKYVFYAKESVEMEVLPVFLLNSPSIENTLFLPASFDIGKWIRSVDFSFVAKDISKPISIKRGDPLFFVKFKPKNDDKVVLERVEQSQELEYMARSCTDVKNRVLNIPLPELYNLAKSHINLFLKKIHRGKNG